LLGSKTALPLRGFTERSLVGRIFVVGAAKPAILQDFFLVCKGGGKKSLQGLIPGFRRR
jgi:hypothetical protein